MDDEEEILIALAESLSNFIDFVGGPAHCLHVMKPLEKLCQVEETTVREKVILFSINLPKATEGIKKILTMVKIKDIEGHVVEMVKRLMASEGYTSKFAGI